MIIPSKVVNKVGEGVSSGEPIAFQQDKDMTHIEAPSSTMVLLITCFTYNVNLEGYMIRKVRLHISSIKLHSELVGRSMPLRSQITMQCIAQGNFEAPLK
jgi:hypothetical protein